MATAKDTATPFTDTATLRAEARKHIDQGPVTRNFPEDRETIIAQLNKALATEWVCVLRYLRRTKDPEHSLESARWYWARLHEMATIGHARYVLGQLRSILSEDEVARLS